MTRLKLDRVYSQILPGIFIRRWIIRNEDSFISTYGATKEARNVGSEGEATKWYSLRSLFRWLKKHDLTIEVRLTAEYSQADGSWNSGEFLTFVAATYAQLKEEALRKLTAVNKPLPETKIWFHQGWNDQLGLFALFTVRAPKFSWFKSKQ